MLATLPRRRSKHSSYKRLVDYLLDPKDTQERVGRVTVTNCQSDDVDAAVLEVLTTQQFNTRVEDKTMHLIFTFAKDETPSEEILVHIEQRLCLALGLAVHQRISVVHHDTDNLHVHVAINRVHPTTLRGHAPKFSKYVLAYAGEALEKEHNLLRETKWHLERQDLGRAAVALRGYLGNVVATDLRQAASWEEVERIANLHGASLEARGNGMVFRHHNRARVRSSDIHRELSLAKLQARLGPAALGASAPQVPPHHAGPRHSTQLPSPPAMEPLGNIESFIGWLQRGAVPALQAATSWEGIHQLANEHGFSIVLRGNGLLFRSRDGVVAKASSVARDLSKAALERRLGPFQPPMGGMVPAGQHAYRRGARGGNSALYARYIEDCAQVRLARTQQLDVLRVERAAAFKTCADNARQRWNRIKDVTHDREARKIWSEYVRATTQRQRSALCSHFDAQYAEVRTHHRLESWMDWARRQAAQGDKEALAMLRARSRRVLRKGNTATGPSSAIATAQMGTRALYEQYRAERERAYQAHREAQQRLAEASRAARAKLEAELRQRRTALEMVAPGSLGRPIWEQALRRFEVAKLMKLESDFRAQRAALAHPPREPFADFLRREAAAGNPQALAVSPTPFAAIDSVTSEGTVIYSVPGGQVRDDGERLSLSTDTSPAAAEALLHLAHAKWGPQIGIDGSAAFRLQMVRAAVESTLPIRFIDPLMEQQRRTLQKETHDQRPKPADLEPRSNIQAATGAAANPTRGGASTTSPDDAERGPRARRSRRRRPPHTRNRLPGMPTRHVADHGPRAPDLLLPTNVRGELQQRTPSRRGANQELRRPEHRPGLGDTTGAGPDKPRRGPSKGSRRQRS